MPVFQAGHGRFVRSLQGLNELSYLFLGALQFQGDTLRVVDDRPGQTETCCQAKDRRTKADPLHTARYMYPFSNHVMVLEAEESLLRPDHERGL